MNTLRFAFAKRHGVLVADMGEQGVKVLYHQAPSLEVLAEIRRHVQKPIICEQVSNEIFNEH